MDLAQSAHFHGLSSRVWSEVVYSNSTTGRSCQRIFKFLMNAVLALIGSFVRLGRPILVIILFSAALFAVYCDILTDKRFSLVLLLAPMVAIAAWCLGVAGGVVSTLVASLLPMWIGWMLNVPATWMDYGAVLVRFLVLEVRRRRVSF